eukprot:8935335-Heterocapsa_arctica.AAC.1
MLHRVEAQLSKAGIAVLTEMKGRADDLHLVSSDADQRQVRRGIGREDRHERHALDDALPEVR